MRSRNRSNNSIEFICYWEVYFFYASASEFGVLFSFTENLIRFGFKMCCSIMSDIFAINVCISWAPKTYVCLSTHEYACISHSRIRSSCLIRSRCFQCCRAFGGIIVLNAFFPLFSSSIPRIYAHREKKNHHASNLLFYVYLLHLDWALIYSTLFCSVLLCFCRVCICVRLYSACAWIYLCAALCARLYGTCVWVCWMADNKRKEHADEHLGTKMQRTFISTYIHTSMDW